MPHPYRSQLPVAGGSFAGKRTEFTINNLPDYFPTKRQSANCTIIIPKLCATLLLDF